MKLHTRARTHIQIQMSTQLFHAQQKKQRRNCLILRWLTCTERDKAGQRHSSWAVLHG